MDERSWAILSSVLAATNGALVQIGKHETRFPTQCQKMRLLLTAPAASTIYQEFEEAEAYCDHMMQVMSTIKTGLVMKSYSDALDRQEHSSQ